MARYRITIEFHGDQITDEQLLIDAPLSTNVFEFTFFKQGESYVGNNPIEYVVGIPYATNYNFQQAFRTYYNLGGLYTVTNSSSSAATHIEGEFASEPVLGGVLPTNVTWVVESLSELLVIESLAWQKNVADTCNKIDIIITAETVFDELIQPYAETFANTLTKTVTNLSRDRYYTIQIKDENGERATTSILTPSFLNTGLIDVVIFNNTVTINATTRGLILQYSLDGTNYQPENVFPNLSGGDYDLYIKDNYDCIIQTTFTIQESVSGTIIIPEPYFLYPKANCLRMAKREQWDEMTIHKNSSNTLSCETINGISYTEKQRWRSEDIIPIQIKTNYPDLKVITSDDDIEQTIVQKSASMNVKSSMDCKIVDLGENRYGIYFISGKTYNYDTDADLGEDYVLNGQLPQFAKVGNIVTINSINYTIEELSFNQDLEVDQLVISSITLTGITDDEIKAIYNIFNYEVYEVNIDMSGRTTLNVQIWYDGVIKMVSELILIDDISERLGMLKWSHKHNTDMFYATGIEPFMRLLMDSKASPKNESENYETDSDVFQSFSDNYESDTFTFDPISKERARLLVLALSQSNVEIRGVGYVKEGTPEMEALEGTNLYVVTAVMVLKGTGLITEQTDLSNVEIPTLLKTDLDGYIKIN